MARIKDPQAKKQSSSRRYSRAKSSVLPSVHSYKVVGDPAQVLREIPDGVLVALVPPDATTEKKLLRIGSGRIQRFWGHLAVPQGRLFARVRSGAIKRKPVVDASAFEPNSRAKALLRGVQIAQNDLKESGGAYDLDQVRVLMNGISRQMVDRKVREGSLLSVPGPSNRRAYPTVQFNHDGTVVPGLKAVQEALPTENPWAVLNFLVRPDSRLDGRKPIDLLKCGEIDLVVDAARRMGQQGS